MSRLSQRIENFRNAFNILNDSITSYNNDKLNKVMHMALVQSFEVCFELGWKIVKDYLENKNVIVKIPREVIKEAFKYNILQDGQIWIDMLNARNLTSHEYNQEKVDLILDKISTSYFYELKILYNKLEYMNE